MSVNRRQTAPPCLRSVYNTDRKVELLEDGFQHVCPFLRDNASFNLHSVSCDELSLGGIQNILERSGPTLCHVEP